VQAPFYSPIESPAVVTQVQTHTGGDWTKTRRQAVTNDGFRVKLEEDGVDTTHNQEMFGWMTKECHTCQVKCDTPLRLGATMMLPSQADPALSSAAAHV
jgi:hypothetical protein